MKLMTAILMLALCATGAMAQQTLSYGWEDGVATHLGFYGNLGVCENVNTFSHTGTNSLYMTEDPISGTPQVYVGWVAGLQDGDQVTVSWWTYDNTPDTDPVPYPRSRVWGHYSTNDINVYAGSASGGATYSTGIGWEEQTYTWTFDGVTDPTRTALVIEYRLYSAVDANTFYCDDITITAPNHALIFFPNQDPVSTVATSFGGLKALYR